MLVEWACPTVLLIATPAIAYYFLTMHTAYYDTNRTSSVINNQKHRIYHHPTRSLLAPFLPLMLILQNRP